VYREHIFQQGATLTEASAHVNFLNLQSRAPYLAASVIEAGAYLNFALSASVPMPEVPGVWEGLDGDQKLDFVVDNPGDLLAMLPAAWQHTLGALGADSLQMEDQGDRVLSPDVLQAVGASLRLMGAKEEPDEHNADNVGVAELALVGDGEAGGQLAGDGAVGDPADDEVPVLKFQGNDLFNEQMDVSTCAAGEAIPWEVAIVAELRSDCRKDSLMISHKVILAQALRPNIFADVVDECMSDSTCRTWTLKGTSYASSVAHHQPES
jgi:hypothetical protein